MRTLLIALLISLACLNVAAAQTVSSGTTNLVGQIVCCAECWAEADRRTTPYGTPANLEKAKSCIANGDPTLLAVMDSAGATTFYELVNGKFKPPGKDWLALVGKHVELTGAVSSKKDRRFVKVDALNLLPTPDTPAAPQETETVGREAELVLKDLFGVEQRLSAYRGRIVVLNFWATYCAPCRKEMPDLAAIQNSYAALGVQVVGASAETLEDKSKILQFVKEASVNFPVWVGATVADMARFGLGPALPGTAIIGRDGKIVYATRGVVNEADLRRRIDALIEEAERDSKAREVAVAKRRDGEASSVPS